MKQNLTNLIKKLILPLLMISLIIRFVIDFNSLINVEMSLNPYTPNQNTTIYAAYSENGTIPDYVVNYLRLLKEISPNIIYITDNPIKKKEISKLKPYVTHLIATRHQEYDWGSFKRGFNWLKKNNYLNDLASPTQKTKGEAFATGKINCCAMSSATNDVHQKEYTSECRCSYDSDLASPLLILANDSTIPTTHSFAPILADMKQKNPHFYGLTANQDGTYHIQSYFLIITPSMYNHPAFANYLNNVTKQKDGLNVAYAYEVPFTQHFANLGFTHSTYIDYNSLSYLPLNDKNCYPLTMLTKYKTPLLKMRTFTNRLNVQESRRLVFSWLKNNAPQSYNDLIKHLKNINSPYLNENR